jgi:hypothetical protein
MAKVIDVHLPETAPAFFRGSRFRSHNSGRSRWYQRSYYAAIRSFQNVLFSDFSLLIGLSQGRRSGR